MNVSHNTAGTCATTTQAGPAVDIEELQQQLSKVRDKQRAPPSTCRRPDSTVQWTSSQDSSKESRPANVHESADSGYGSSAVSPDAHKSEDLGQSLPGTNLKYFNKSIPDHLNKRFFDVKFLYTQPLLEAIRKKRRNAGDIGIKLKYLGLTEDLTEPYIVIQCDKKTAKIVKKFFAQPHIDEELCSDFKLLVLNVELVRLADDDAIQVFADAAPVETWCGVPITMSCGSGRLASATLGGIVTVEATPGQKTCYGLTASHALGNFKAASLRTTDASDSDSDSESKTSDSAPGTTEEASGLSNIELSRSNGAPEDYVDVHSPELIGSVAHHALKYPARRNLDWALVSLENTKLLPNKMLVADKFSPSSDGLKRKYDSKTGSGVRNKANGVYLTWNGSSARYRNNSKSVSVISRRGPQAGTLTFKTSCVMIAPGDNFVDTHDLTMEPTMSKLNANETSQDHIRQGLTTVIGLQPGDSGSWVVNKFTGEVYGYVVSVDVFGEAQVLPLELVLADITEKLQAARVCLPSPDEIDVRRSHTLDTISVAPPADPAADVSDFEALSHLLNVGTWACEGPTYVSTASEFVDPHSFEQRGSISKPREMPPHRANDNRQSNHGLEVQEMLGEKTVARCYGVSRGRSLANESLELVGVVDQERLMLFEVLGEEEASQAI